MPNSLPKELIINPIALECLPDIFKKRMEDSHKGDYGTIGVIGGSRGMEGSVLLAARSALKIGAGKVFVGFTQKNIPIHVDFLQPELMLQTSNKLLKLYLKKINVWVIGCGMGQNYIATNTLEFVLNSISNKVVVLDADALNIIAYKKIIYPTSSSNTIIMTPHPAEAARILDCSIMEIQSNRAQSAERISALYKAWTVLKGYRTIICSPSGNLLENYTGNPGLATSGTGDVLAGMIGSLIGQSIDLKQAVAGAVWLHGTASEYLANIQKGPIGMNASELADAARIILNSKH